MTVDLGPLAITKQCARPRVLVVEDEPRMRELLVDALPDMDFPARAVRSAEDALRVMRADAHEIVLLDLHLPAMDGIELFELLRRDWPRTEVIILTAFGSLESARRAIRLDVVDFLSKPCHLSDLEMALNRACRRLRVEPQSASTASEKSATSLHELERAQILAALERHAGNRTAAAAELGISRRTLHYRLKAYRMQGYDVD